MRISSVGSKLFGHWMTKGFWAIWDQGLFSVSNFALNVLLARWLSPLDYGAFATAFAVFLLIGMLHTGVLAEPMIVFGPGRYKHRLSEYLGVLLYGHISFGVLSCLLLLLASLGLALWGSSTLSTILAALAIAEPFMLLIWLMRRACYACFEPRLAAFGSALYMILMLMGAYACYYLGWVSSVLAFGLMGVSSLVVSLWLAARLRIRWLPFWSDELTRNALENHWRFGRWSAATLVLNWIPLSIYFLLVPFWIGLEASASLRALLNLVVPAQLASIALASVLIPNLVQVKGEAKFGVLVRFAMALFVFGSILYWLFLGVFHEPLVTWLYGGRYAEDANLLWILGLTPTGAAVALIASAALRALEQPDLIFWPYVFSAALALTLGPLLVLAWGITGAILSDLVCSVVAAGTMSYLLYALRVSTREGKEHR